ncbi:MAG: hypothetical protein ACJ71Z_02645 [Aeromicrobium sp.]
MTGPQRKRERGLIIAIGLAAGLLAAAAVGVRTWSPSPDGPHAVPIAEKVWRPNVRGTVTGSVAFRHPAWGPVVLVTSEHPTEDTSTPSYITVVDGHGRVRWSFNTGDTVWYEMKINSPARDKTGNIFINWNPGRYNGVTVLRPTVDGFADFGTLMESGNYNGSHYYADVVDVDHDGIFEIAQHDNNCIPGCAEGKITTKNFWWTGHGYRPRD